MKWHSGWVHVSIEKETNTIVNTFLKNKFWVDRQHEQYWRYIIVQLFRIEQTRVNQYEQQSSRGHIDYLFTDPASGTVPWSTVRWLLSDAVRHHITDTEGLSCLIG